MNELQQIEQEIANYEKHIELHNTYKRLCDNKDFKEIVLKGYLVDHASTLVLNRATPSVLMSVDMLRMQDSAIAGVGGLDQYFNSIERDGNLAKDQIAKSKKTREELLEEAS